MTDDKAGEGPYDHIDAASGEWCVFNCPKCAYDKGRKAERERCAKIAESEPVTQDEWGNIVFGLGEKIAEKIRGGRDEE